MSDEPAPCAFKAKSNQCVLEDGHGGEHVIAIIGRASVSYYSLDTSERLLHIQVHADLKPGEPLSHEEAAAIYAYMVLLRERK